MDHHVVISHTTSTRSASPPRGKRDSLVRSRIAPERSGEDAFASAYVSVAVGGVQSKIRADPSVLPAPHGRSPTGWPLKLCECACGRPIPWPRDPKVLGWVPPRIYNARRFIDSNHAAAWKRNLKNTPNRLYQRLSVTTRPGVIHVTIESITECRRCKNQVNLRDLGIGKECQCGHITFCQEGDWIREAVRTSLSE